MAKLVALIGFPPIDLIREGQESKRWFTSAGLWKEPYEISIPRTSFEEEVGDTLMGEEKKRFCRFVRGMLKWRAGERRGLLELKRDRWVEETVVEEGEGEMGDV